MHAAPHLQPARVEVGVNRSVTQSVTHALYPVATGQKFELPFMVLVIFATNIKPSELVDEAFLRRIHYKVFAESPSVPEFQQIFENCCRARDLPYDRAVVSHLLQNDPRLGLYFRDPRLRALLPLRR